MNRFAAHKSGALPPTASALRRPTCDASHSLSLSLSFTLSEDVWALCAATWPAAAAGVRRTSPTARRIAGSLLTGPTTTSDRHKDGQCWHPAGRAAEHHGVVGTGAAPADPRGARTPPSSCGRYEK